MRKVVLGAVPDRLCAKRDALLTDLSAAGMAVERIERADSMNREVISGKLRGSTYFVQPYDHAAPMGGDILPGGHLAVSQEVFKDGSAAAGGSPGGASMLWWCVEGEVGPAVADLDRETRAFMDQIDALPSEQRRCVGAAELAAELGAQAQPATVAARIWIEWAQTDERTIAEAKEKVREEFQALCRRRAVDGPALSVRLKFLTADWQKLEQKIAFTDKPDGVVIVFNEHKDPEAFDEQSERISSLEDVLQRRMFPGIFYMRPDAGFYAWDDWSAVRFTRDASRLSYDEEELQHFVATLYEVIERKHPQLKRGSGADVG